jgi:hypothetical protein
MIPTTILRKTYPNIKQIDLKAVFILEWLAFEEA